MALATRALILLCGIYICDAGYYASPNSADTQSDVQAPDYVPPYAKNGGYSNNKPYSPRKTGYGGTKTGYGGTKTGYAGTKTGYGGTKTHYGTKQTWHSESGNAPNLEDFHSNARKSYNAICEPECRNNGICVDTNTCHCPINFKGRFCEIEAKPCLSYPPLPVNSMRKCSPDFCTITCLEGHKFAGLGTTVANMACSADGQWTPTIPLLASIPDCEPECNPPCLNGGVCLAVDTCQCPNDYRGPQCQYSTNVCDIRKLAFNGGYNCFGDAESFSCQLTCPDGISFSTPAAELYTCTYSTGVFQPQPIPHCVFNEVTVIRGSNHHHVLAHHGTRTVTNETHTERHNQIEQETGGFEQQSGDFEQQLGGFEQQSGGFEQETGGFEQEIGGFEQQTGGFEQQSGGFEQQSGGFEQQSGGFEQQTGGFEQHSGFTPRNPIIVIQDLTPKGGVCFTWAGMHYKTFDGKIYSFQSPCQHILVRDRLEHRYSVAIQQGDCKRQAYCPAELTVYLEDKPYILSVGEDGSVLFRSTHRLIPIPASLPGIRVSMPSDHVIVNLDADGVTIKWDTNNLVIVEGTVQLWNNTEGLCGLLNGSPDDDFLTKDGTIASTRSVMASSWKINKIGDVCNDSPTDTSACASRSKQDMKNAKLFCASIFSKEKFRKCSKVMDVTQLLETCQWDYCACLDSQSAEECACSTVAVYAKECLRNGVEDMKNWRDVDTCPMKCPSDKVYNACGPDTQPSCVFPNVPSQDNITCVEGCFCPKDKLLEGGKCIAKSECPCRLRNKSFQPGHVLAKDCNTCACQAGEWTCTQAPCGARCSAMGDPHYTTFDGLRYDFMGHCTYDFMRTDNVTIEVENVACSGAISEAMNLTPYKGEGKPSCTKATNIKYGTINVHLKQGGYILVNGQEVSSLPVVFGDVRIRAASSLFIIVQLPNKVDVWWDGNTRVFVDVPPEFHGKTKGLCGTFNLNQKDDFLTPEGDVEQSAHAFANKWKTREFCQDVDLKEPEHPCKANVENKEAAEKYCSRLKSKLFESCHWFVDVEPFYESCLYDMCACAGDISRCLCPIIGDYAMACAKSGVLIQWRYNVKECELSCNGGQEYSVCADSCLRTCSDVASEGTGVCKPSCVEGCACPPGQVLNDHNVCVPTGMCPCYHKGMKLDAGYKEVRAGKREREICTCVGARWECVPATTQDIQNYPPAESLRSNCSAVNHMEFTTCETADPLTCKNMHLPPSTITAECRPGCQCKKGYVLDTASKKCVLSTECPCHHGGRSYIDGHVMQEECNKCECKNGNWTCTTRKCAGVCSAWGDSHVTTFDGTDYDFEGVCTYLLAKGALDGKDGFDVVIQNVPCGTTGATCSKTITLKVGNGNNEEIVSLTKNSPLPDLSKLKRIKLRTVGVFVYLDVPSQGMSLQWDRGMRVYVKVDSMWQGRLKGLCGNYNGDMRDDFQTPGGGIPESSALIFVDSWKLKSTCPKPEAVRDHCQQRSERKDYATTACGALKRFPFTLCHTEVPPTGFIERCEKDACACDSGEDCTCICTALAAYAHLCSSRGVSFKWRTQETCPMQCDEECSNYDDCLSSCPLETCDNTLDYAEIKTICEQDTCVEGCKPKKSCPEGTVYTNNTFTECVPRSKCRRVCMVLPDDGKEVLEGEITEEDACHTCRCSKAHIVCNGQPCSSTAPYLSTVPPTEKPHDEPLKCVTGWTAWVNRGPPETGPNGESLENEPLPKPNELQIGSPMCQASNMSEIECRTTVNHKSAKDTGLNAECSLERGLVCKETGNLCPDFEIRVHCQCEDKEEPEQFQCLDSDHPSYPHPSDCSMFYECTPDATQGLKHAVLKNCGEGLMYNPVTMVCDWPDAVKALRSDCALRTSTTYTPSPPVTESRCPPGQEYLDCAYQCDQLCHHFKKTLRNNGRCKGRETCVEGCIDKQCENGTLRRDDKTCVPDKDCTCYFDGKVVKPGGVVRDGCMKCQCLNNELHCDTSDCESTITPATQPPTTPTPTQPPTSPTTITTEPIPTNPPLIIRSTVTPPPDCEPDRYKNLLWDDEPLSDSAFNASSIANELFAPQYAVLNGHPLDVNAGSWNPAVQDENQYIQVTLPKREPIYGVIMQGSPIFDQYVTSYEVMYGDDGHIFSIVEGSDGKPKVFRGPVDNNNPVKQMLQPPIEAKVLRIRPLTWHDSIAVRFELIGCGEPATATTITTPLLTSPPILQCTEPLGLAADLPIENIEVSSNNDLRRYFTLDSEKGWKPAYSTPGEWIMFDFTSPRNITGIKTKGGQTGWVTAYNVMYTSDLSTFNPVIDNTGSYKVFPANFDKDSVVFNEFRPPIHARYLKVLPLKWKSSIEMRVEPIGCFSPYPVTRERYDDTTPTVLPCELCPGVKSNSCACDGEERYYDGENCVSRDQCPCVEGFMTYAVGSSFRGANCDECVCKLGGITDCKPVKECKCASDLVPKLTDDCECICEPCPNGTRICPTSHICLNLDKWCDGLQDCPDDEVDCKNREPLVITTVEPTMKSTHMSTVAATPPVTVATKPAECPKVECPPGYFVRYATSSSYSQSSSQLPPPRPRQSYTRYTKGGSRGRTKTTFTKTKSVYTKTAGASKGGYSKGGYVPPPPIPIPNQQPTANVTSKKECQQFKCVPNLPPPFKPGSTPPPVVCSTPVCPPQYTWKLDNVHVLPNQCPQYICVPPPERFAFCNMTGRTINTFDGAEYKYDTCFHILARENRFNSWSVLVRKVCSTDGCENQLMLHQDDDVILVKPNLRIQYNQYEYSVEQTSKICFQKNSFDVNQVGNGLVIKSRRYNFVVFFSTDGNVKIGVSSKYLRTLDGLCGFYSEDLTDERRKPDGSLATSIDEFGRSWAKPGLRPDACEAKIIPPEKQKKTWELCDVITKEPISRCGEVLNLDKWRSICLEKICECTDLIVNGTKKTEEECRCLFLDTLVAQCLAADKDIDLGDWRLQMDCPAECSAPLVHYDCYRRRCEPACSALGTAHRVCPAESGLCFPGCYCPDGKLRKGDTCVSPPDCLDCICTGVGTPAKYVSFEGDDLPSLGNCTYLASRDRNETGQHKYEVYATNGPCEDLTLREVSVCTKAVHVIYEKNIVQITKDEDSEKLITTINSTPVYKYPLNNDWISVTLYNGRDVSLLLTDAHVEIKVQQAKMQFSVHVASYLYANQTEGLCGVCAGYQEQLITSNGTVTDDFDEYGKSWQVTPAILRTLDIPTNEQCGEAPPQRECKLPPPDQNPCYNLANADRFGSCHALLDPHSYIESCEEELCAHNTTDACAILERYTSECSRLGVCLDWREGLCPYECSEPLVYTPCMTCERTCENNAALEYNPQSCEQTFVEGCYCPKGKVRVNNTCIEPNKCFPCDANKDHYAGDEWQEDACTKCTCSKIPEENTAHVSCTTQTCAVPVCSEDEDRITEPPKPGACCTKYMCVPKPQGNLCEEPKKMECGFGQILKQKTTPKGCKQFACECKPASECERIPTENEVDILEPGMERVIDNSGCCARVLMLCKPESCPIPPACPQYHQLRTDNVTGKCCPSYECEAPKDKCIASLEWEAAPKGGERQRIKTQVILKELESVWLDGPCRSCTCVRTPLGPSAQCSSTQCQPIAATDQFVLEPRAVPFACCPEPQYVACRDGDNIYRVGENWTSLYDVCESYKCVETDDGKLEKITTLQSCHTECDAGWSYTPADPNSGKCCGKCTPVSCIHEGVQHKVGEAWTSADFCEHYICVEDNGTLHVQSQTDMCQEVSLDVKKNFLINQISVPGNCCKTQELVACRVGDIIYQEGSTWSTSDPCKNITCARDSSNKLTHKETIETCVRDCKRGWVYEEPAAGVCCGHCVQDSCIVDGELRTAGSTWYSSDNCTTYTCEREGEGVAVTLSRPSCPDVSGCRAEDLVNETCCQVCREAPPALSTCVPTSLGLESVGVIRVHLHSHGLCVNTHKIDQFKECRGTCDSGTIYNNHTGSHDSNCECCQALKYEPVTIQLRCEDGTTQQHQVASPTRCGCRRCGGGALQPWPERTTAVYPVEDEIPEMYQRFGSSTGYPRKH